LGPQAAQPRRLSSHCAMRSVEQVNDRVQVLHSRYKVCQLSPSNHDPASYSINHHNPTSTSLNTFDLFESTPTYPILPAPHTATIMKAFTLVSIFLMTVATVSAGCTDHCGDVHAACLRSKEQRPDRGSGSKVACEQFYSRSSHPSPWSSQLTSPKVNA